MSKPSSPSCLSTGVGILLVGAIALLCVLAYGTSHYGWPIYLELFSHFQVQYFVLSLVLLGLILLLRRRGLILIGLFLCAILALPVVSWYVPPKRLLSNSPDADLRVLVANINTQNTSYDKVLAMVRDEQPDIAIMIEVNQAWRTALEGLSDILPYSSGQTQDFNFGLLVYSTLPLNNTQIEFFGTEEIPSVVARLTVENQPVTLIATHPLPPVKPSFFHARNRQFAAITEYVDSVEGRVILAGDLNATMWSPYYRRLENRTGLRNAREGFGILPTWPEATTYQPISGWLTSLLLIPIDHCLVSAGFEVTEIHTGAETGSDHRPLVMDVQLVNE